jgi:outer membrane protein assembly factor BamD
MRLCQRGVTLTMLVMVGCLVLPAYCPAPLIWRRGEGWSYERAGVLAGKTPQEQLEIARGLHKQQNYGDAITAYRRLVRRWPTAFAAQDARLGLAECLVATDYHFKAFQEYQNLITKHPNSPHFDTALQRESDIGKKFLGGMRHKVWGMKWFPGTEYAVRVFEQIVKNGPYSKVAPDAQFHLGLAHEKLQDYPAAIRDYELLLERYPKLPIAETGQFQIGLAYRQQATRAEYDQSVANQAIAAFGDFVARYPKSDKVPVAEKYQRELRAEQARGLFQIAKFYEKQKRYKSAIIYYNEVIEQLPKSDWAAQAEKKIAGLTPLAQAPAPKK